MKGYLFGVMTNESASVLQPVNGSQHTIHLMIEKWEKEAFTAAFSFVTTELITRSECKVLTKTAY